MSSTKRQGNFKVIIGEVKMKFPLFPIVNYCPNWKDEILTNKKIILDTTFDLNGIRDFFQGITKGFITITINNCKTILDLACTSGSNEIKNEVSKYINEQNQNKNYIDIYDKNFQQSKTVIVNANNQEDIIKKDNINEIVFKYDKKTLNQEIIDLKNIIKELEKNNEKQRKIIKENKEIFSESITNALQMYKQMFYKPYYTVERELNDAFDHNDYDLIDLLIGKVIDDEKSGFSFKLDESKHTAGVFKYKGTSENVIIPRLVLYNSQKFHVTSILPNAFKSDTNVKSICCEENSELMIIYEKSFDDSAVEEIFIPQHFIEFKDRWSYNAKSLKRVFVSPLNKNFTYNSDKFLLTKSDLFADNYDVIIFAPRDIEIAIIPQNIKIISSCAFAYCKQLQKVEFAANSELDTIENNAFCDSIIEKITLPSNLMKIDSCSFFNCQNLKELKFVENAQIVSFEETFLTGSSIESIDIPQKVNYIDSECFICADKLVNVFVSPLNKNYIFLNNQFLLRKSDPFTDLYNVFLFSRRDIVEAIVPSYIEIISSCAFSNCYYLKTISFDKNSHLNIIEKFAFMFDNFKRITIPSHTTIIDEYAFAYCKINVIELEKESELNTIGKYAFANSSINSFYVPKNVSNVGKYTFHQCKKLQIIEISENSKLKWIDQSIFIESSLKIIMVPADLKDTSSLVI